DRAGSEGQAAVLRDHHLDRHRSDAHAGTAHFVVVAGLAAGAAVLGICGSVGLAPVDGVLVAVAESRLAVERAQARTAGRRGVGARRAHLGAVAAVRRVVLQVHLATVPGVVVAIAESGDAPAHHAGAVDAAHLLMRWARAGLAAAAAVSGAA